jgi:hypothetical protein
MPVTNNPRCYLSISSLARKRPIVPSEQSAFSLPTKSFPPHPITTYVPIRCQAIPPHYSIALLLGQSPQYKVTDGSFNCGLLDRMGRVEYKLQPVNVKGCSIIRAALIF